MDDQQEMVDFLRREKVDVVVACDMTREEIVSSPSGESERLAGRSWRVAKHGLKAV